jgi:hypothetical protein
MPIIGGGNAPGPGEVICQEVLFTEVSNTGGTYTGSVTVPPNSWLLDIKVYGQVLWTSATSATLKVGDGVDDDGWYIGINVKATDLLVNEVLSMDSAGGKPGAYNVAVTALRKTQWSSLERIVTGVITTVTAAASIAGRTRMLVIYTSTSNPVTATFAP